MYVSAMYSLRSVILRIKIIFKRIGNVSYVFYYNNSEIGMPKSKF